MHLQKRCPTPVFTFLIGWEHLRGKGGIGWWKMPAQSFAKDRTNKLFTPTDRQWAQCANPRTPFKFERARARSMLCKMHYCTLLALTLSCSTAAGKTALPSAHRKTEHKWARARARVWARALHSLSAMSAPLREIVPHWPTFQPAFC